jgi:hypothetical protein
MYFVSIANDDTGEWIGGCFLNASTEEEASDKAAKVAGRACNMQIAMLPVPPGSPGIPAAFYGRLLNRDQIDSIQPGELVDFKVDDEGTVEVTGRYPPRHS